MVELLLEEMNTKLLPTIRAILNINTINSIATAGRDAYKAAAYYNINTINSIALQSTVQSTGT